LFEWTAKVEREEHFAEHAKSAGLARSDAQTLAEANDDVSPDMAKRASASGDTVCQTLRGGGNVLDRGLNRFCFFCLRHPVAVAPYDFHVIGVERRSVAMSLNRGACCDM